MTKYPTITHALLAHAEHTPERAFITFHAGELQWSFAQTLEQARLAAGALVAHGVRRGNRIIIMGGNEPSTVALLLGAMGIGVTPAVVHPPLRADLKAARKQLAALVRRGEPALVMAPEALWPEEHGGVVFATAERLLGGGTAPRDLQPPDPDALGYLQFSSGTTGAQKAVGIAAGSQALNAAATGVEIEARPDEKWVIWLPLYHDMGLMSGLLVPLYFGHQTVLTEPERFVEKPLSWPAAVDRYRGTLSVAPNFAFALVARRAKPDRIAGMDLSCLRVAFNGAEMVSADTVLAFERAFAPAKLRPNTVYPVYGLAEFTLSAAYWHVGEPIRVDAISREALSRGEARPAEQKEDTVRLVSVGTAVDGHQLRIVSSQGECGQRQVGEIQMRGPSRMVGYLGDPQQTAEVFDRDWLRTGDLGYVADGDLFVCGRKKELIIRFGENYYPADLETVIAAAPGVKPGRLAVLAIEDAAIGTERAWLVVETGLEGEEAYALAQSLRAYLIDAVGFKLDGVSCVPLGSLQKTSSGKIRRPACRELLVRAFAAGSPPPSVGRWPL